MAKNYTLWLFRKKREPIDVDYATKIQDARKKAYEVIKMEPNGSVVYILEDNAKYGTGEVGKVFKDPRYRKGSMIWQPNDGKIYYLRPNGTIV